MNFGQSLGFLSFLISLYILWEIRQIILLTFSAIIFSVALNRIVKKLLTFGFNRTQSILIALFGFLLLTNIIIFLVFPPFIEQFQLLINILPKVPNKFNDLLDSLNPEDSPIFNFLVNNISKFINENNIFVPKQIFDNFIAFFSNAFNIVFKTSFVLVLTVVFLINPSKYRRYIIKLSPSFYRHRVVEILDKSESAIVLWLNGIIINCIFIGLLSGIGLWVLQVKLVLVHGLLAGLLNFIPNIGPTLSVVFPITIALVESPWKIIPILIWYFIIQNIESYWLTPKVMADKVSLLPAVTLFAQIFFATIFGLLGLLLALPLTVVAKTWIEELLFKDILDQWDSP